MALGVIGGLAEKFGWEAKPLRILAGLLGVLTIPLGALPVIIPYVTLWAITRVPGTSQPLRRSRDDQMIAGVLGGVAEWLGVRSGLVRVTYCALTLATFGLPGVVTYLVMWAKTKPAGADRSQPTEP